MGTGEVARYLGTLRHRPGSRRPRSSPRWSPSCCKTDDNPDGVAAGRLRRHRRRRHGRPLRLLHGVLQELLQPRRDPRHARLSEEACRRSWNVATSARPLASAAAQPTWLTDFRADIPKIDVPALIVHGTADNILPIDVTGRRFTKALPGRRVCRDRGRPARHALDARRRGQRGAAGVPGEMAPVACLLIMDRSRRRINGPGLPFTVGGRRFDSPQNRAS